MPERRSPFYDYHLRHAGQLIRGGGDYMFPDAYTSGRDEHLNTRTNVGMQDISSMGEVDIKGAVDQPAGRQRHPEYGAGPDALYDHGQRGRWHCR
jgi:glycine cleavage system aminomethyltransferase T